MKAEKKLFPLFTDLSEKKAVVLGGGKIAARRIQTLLDFTGQLVVIAPQAVPRIEELAEEGQIVLIKKKYEREDIYDADLVLAATDDPAVNSDIYSACKCLGILVNTASDQTKCDFHFPGIICHDGVTIGFNGAGKNHGGVRQMREKVESFLKETKGEL